MWSKEWHRLSKIWPWKRQANLDGPAEWVESDSLPWELTAMKACIRDLNFCKMQQYTVANSSPGSISFWCPVVSDVLTRKLQTRWSFRHSVVTALKVLWIDCWIVCVGRNFNLELASICSRIRYSYKEILSSGFTSVFIPKVYACKGRAERDKVALAVTFASSVLDTITWWSAD